MRVTINYKLIIHVLIWGVLLFLPYIVSNAASQYSIGNLPGRMFTIMTLIHMGVFYTHSFYLYPRFFNLRFWWLYTLTVLALIWISLLLKFQIAETWFPEALRNKRESYGLIIGGSVDIYFISLAYSRIFHRIRQEREQKERQAAQLATELKFLRSQISPHFLFNVLTNLVSLARKKSDQLESALIMLSELMRYMLYDTQGKKVALPTEIRYLNSYIQLQRLRFGNDVAVECEIDAGPQAEQYIIEPMLLIPFVENAFKHGVGAVDRPQIEMRLAVREGRMRFEVRNSFDESFSAGQEEHTGLGLNNVRTRLELLYPKNHHLDIRKEDNWFHIVLTLKLI
ncbi:MAG TPA: histidine kinase [Puia sp.]|jgi:two-component system LytT family sensor kinase|nr:histidine kinase [Puia sp.]